MRVRTHARITHTHGAHRLRLSKREQCWSLFQSNLRAARAKADATGHVQRCTLQFGQSRSQRSHGKF